MQPIELTFLGAVGTVTGSKTLLQVGDVRILVDCGLFQGLKELRKRNWSALPVKASDVNAVVLTHAHIDHSGYLPLFVKKGFAGKVFATHGTCDLAEILLPDSGYLHEQDAAFANRHGFSKHKPALPLYTQADAEACLKQLYPVKMRKPLDIANNIHLHFNPAGHILGAANAVIHAGGTRIMFSGDIGRADDPILHDPAPGEAVDFLIVESTYGGRQHSTQSVKDALADIITSTSAKGGTIVIPAFAVGRTQLIMYYLRELKDEDKIPNIPIFLDSPMAINASEIFRRHHQLHSLDANQTNRICDVVRYVHEIEDSKALDTNKMPKIIISASGMATGGRILHHLKHYVTDERNFILFTGYQAPGTRGAAMIDGAKTIKIHGQHLPVRAQVNNLDMLSAHADEDEIMNWLHTFPAPPRKTFINHGEIPASSALAARIERELGWACYLPKYLEKITLHHPDAA